MARFGATLFGAAAIVTFLGLVFTHQRQVDVLGLEILTGVGAVTAIGLLLWGERAPLWVYMGVIALGTALVSLGVVSNGERHGGAPGGDEMYYLWVVLYGADFAARIGGDEFAVLLPATGAEGTRVLGERLSHALCERGPAERSLGLSCGVAVPTEGRTELDDVMRAADDALYASKDASGKGPGRGRLARRAPTSATPA
jgi:hypothetical protein